VVLAAFLFWPGFTCIRPVLALEGCLTSSIHRHILPNSQNTMLPVNPCGHCWPHAAAALTTPKQMSMQCCTPGQSLRGLGLSVSADSSCSGMQDAESMAPVERFVGSSPVYQCIPQHVVCSEACSCAILDCCHVQSPQCSGPIYILVTETCVQGKVPCRHALCRRGV
jgi:hypothetical protein